jgi:hypothetical protein
MAGESENNNANAESFCTGRDDAMTQAGVDAKMCDAFGRRSHLSSGSDAKRFSVLMFT